jgi:lipoprotein-anchoring transpeptidase ErfK/SrfK
VAKQVFRGTAFLWQSVAAALLLVATVLAPGPVAATERPRPAAPPWLEEVRSVLDLPRSLKPGEHAWHDAESITGPLRIFIDLESELVHVLRGGTEIGRAKIISGSDNKPTPTGAFRILQKSEDHVSNIYHVPMPYMMRLTWDGVAIHATDVRGRSATNGCVGVPEDFAARLFKEVRLGTEVVVTRVEIPDRHLRMNGGLHGLLGLLSLRESV